jgi:Fe-S-cluster-containing dehydrogenase component
MSENKENISSPKDNTPDSNYWKSFKELYQNKSEIDNNASDSSSIDDLSSSGLSGMSRRKFFALIGASAALAGVGCSDYRDKGEIVPYNVKPEEITAGKENFYASTCDACTNSCGILIKTREGRPIKIDGNPDHPVNKGKICARGQANILNLYDPERLKEPLTGGSGFYSAVKWDKADKEIQALFAKANSSGKEIIFVTHTITSPSLKKVFDDFKEKYPTTKVYSYELFNSEVKNSAWLKCYGKGNFPLINWNKAKIILTLEGDILSSEGHKVETLRMFTEKRDVSKPKDYSRLYCVEGDMSVTGMNADYRLKLRPDAQFDFVMSLLNEIVIKKNISNSSVSSILSAKLNNYSLKSFAEKYGLSIKTLNFLIADLIKNQGRSIVYAGNSLSEETHIATNLLNEIISSEELYNKEKETLSLQKLSNIKELVELVWKMKSGKVGVLVHFDSNPVYHFPKNLEYESGLKNVETIISLVQLENESSLYAKYILPINHTFESWGDYKTRTGLISLQQPVIAPLYNTRQKEAIALNWLAQDAAKYQANFYYEYLRSRWEKEVFPVSLTQLDFKDFWNASLHDGIAYQKDESKIAFSFITASLADISSSPKKSEGFSLLLKESYALGDGRFSNNGWLQELPHPVSKIVWDNYAAISESSAKELNAKTNDLIEIEVNGQKCELPVLIQPGIAHNTIAVQLGYGRSKTGIIGVNVGHNANVLLSKEKNSSPWLYSNVKISKTGRTYKLISSQEANDFDNTLTKDAHIKREIIREGTVEEYKKNPAFLKEEKKEEKESIYKVHEYRDVKWGMSIDQNKCIGCGDCVAACNVENNIPVVGKDQVEKGRNMQWLRVDRYYAGTSEEPIVSHQPMLCQHCDKAPCEQVCPVAATTHSPDGLNQMVYNRCVGTRYCSNNCPYKVRRFNFFNFRDHFRNGIYESPVLSLLHNPEVTVRSRGVMEKCTFCIQRIMEAREEAIRNNVPLKGSDVKTACQESCNANAINFGDINDKESEFSEYRNHELGYYVLDDVNTRPNVTYIAKLRNISSEEK